MLQRTTEGIVLTVKVTPKASFNEIVGWENDMLKIRIRAVPEKGAANQELISFLAKKLNIGKSQVILLKGSTTRIKRICLKGLNLEETLFLQDT